MPSFRRNILVDGNNILHRAQAIFVDYRSDDPMISPSGYPTGLIYGFLSMLSDWVTSVDSPSSMSVFFDGVPKRRLAMDPDYKKKDPGSVRPGSLPYSVSLLDGTDARNELEVICALLSLMGVDVYHHPDEEADDVIATYVTSHSQDVNVIFSSDRDYYQLLATNDRVIMFRPGKSGGSKFYDSESAAEDLRKKFDAPVRPSDLLMFKALTGDASDGIFGVPRLRKKVAAPLCRHRTVEDLFSTGLPGFSKVEREKTESLRDRIALNLRLVAFDTSVDLVSCLRRARPDHALAGRVLREDLGIGTVHPGCFTFARSAVRTGSPVEFNPLPDFLRDI